MYTTAILAVAGLCSGSSTAMLCLRSDFSRPGIRTLMWSESRAPLEMATTIQKTRTVAAR